ncbi:DUF421 domain-containing protein [Clostridium sp. JS66]|uniref:DUF421 domain-containing protein n=1 Tax=Clostridium sp. JS66 TaxID=3064705 RepID=UPI00298DC393|nr:DUF421 domain-containing protein [Clostridium sp. JS66]WPC44608.1 DUF421 domain-containing protein [Clostridium sp. JS66]
MIIIKFLKLGFEIFIRNAIALMLLFSLTRFMGKKQVSQLTFFDYCVGISIGSIAASFSVDENIPYFEVIESLIIWGVFPILVSYFSLKCMFIRRKFEDTPTILVQNGKIIERNLRKERFNINDLLEELRLNGVFNIKDVEFAILETTGKVSVQLKREKLPLTPYDLKIPVEYEGLCASVVIDGKIMYSNLKLMNLNESWLKNQLKKQKIKSLNEVFFASVDTNNNLYVSLKNNNIKDKNIMD